MNWETLICFGDSITFGARSYLGYPERCGELLSKRLDKSWHVINHSTNGFTTIDLTRSINSELSNYKNLFPSLITVLIGTNDIKQKVSPNDFVTAYSLLLIKLRLLSVGDNILLLKIPRLSKTVFYPYTFSMNEQVREFNSLIEKMAKENQLRTFEFSFDDEDYFDGVHLNVQGVESAAAQLSGFILKDKGF